jgi:hypothetical protein
MLKTCKLHGLDEKGAVSEKTHSRDLLQRSIENPKTSPYKKLRR